MHILGIIGIIVVAVIAFAIIILIITIVRAIIIALITPTVIKGKPDNLSSGLYPEWIDKESIDAIIARLQAAINAKPVL